MPKFRKRPTITTAEQYHNVPNGWPVGVCAGCDDLGLTIGPHVHTAHNNQAVELEDGDWIVPEPDGKHFYPIRSDIFEATYEPVDARGEAMTTTTGPTTHYVLTYELAGIKWAEIVKAFNPQGAKSRAPKEATNVKVRIFKY